MTPSPIGRHKSELDTPAYCIDLDTLERNITRMSSFLQEAGKQWRPHAKCHKNPVVAHKQIAAGALGVTVAKVSEAEVYARAGIRDILVANMIAGDPKVRRAAALCRSTDLIVACDHFAQAEALAVACRAAGTTCRVIIEVDLGLNRVGIRPGPDFRDLARGIAKLSGVSLCGIMGYEGHLLRVQDVDEKRERITAAMELLVEQRQTMLDDGLNCEIVSAGGTGSYQFTAHCPGVTEIQAGGGVFADPFYANQCGVTGLEPAVSLIATVTSRPKLERAVTDSGRKSLHWELEHPVVRGTVEGRPLPDADVKALSAEHGILELGPQSQDLTIGDKIELTPGYSDFTTILHPVVYAIRDGMVEAVWPIEARGMLQ